MTEDYISKFLLFVLGLVMFCFMIGTAYKIGYDSGHRAGQVDALNGKIHYRLVRQENNEFLWVQCPDVCSKEEVVSDER